jgi:hypothetical protein
VLVFEPNRVSPPDSGRSLHEVYEDSPRLRLFCFTHRADFHHTVYWRDRLRVRVKGSSTARETAEFDLEQTSPHSDAIPPRPLRHRFVASSAARHLAARSASEAGYSSAPTAREYPMVESVPLLSKRPWELRPRPVADSVARSGHPPRLPADDQRLGPRRLPEPLVRTLARDGPLPA